jgi:hypothetical protein
VYEIRCIFASGHRWLLIPLTCSNYVNLLYSVLACWNCACSD